jgi:hypothetical protein
MVKFWIFDEVVETTDDEETVRKNMSEDYFIEGSEWGFIQKVAGSTTMKRGRN